MPPATRSKRALEEDTLPATRSGRTTRSLAAKSSGRTTRSLAARMDDEGTGKTSRSKRTVQTIQDSATVRDAEKMIQKPSGAKTTKRRKPKKRNEIPADEEEHHPGGDIVEKQSGLSLNNDEDGHTPIIGGQIDVDGEAKDDSELHDQTSKDAEQGKALLENPPEATLIDILPRQTASAPSSPKAMSTNNTDGDFSTAITNQLQLTVASSEAITTVPPIPPRPRPQPITRDKDRGTDSTDALDYDGNLMERVRSIRLKDQAVTLRQPETHPEVEALFDDGDDDALSSKAVHKDDGAAKSPEGADSQEDDDSVPNLMPRERQRRHRQIVHDSDSDEEHGASPHQSPPAQPRKRHVSRRSDISNSHQDNPSSRRYTAAEKGKQPQVAPTGARKAKQSSSKSMALYADDDSEGDGEVDEDDDNAEEVEGPAKRGPFPIWALEEAQEIRRTYIESIAALAVRAKKSVAATTNLVEGKEAPKKDHYWNMYQSWYGEHGPTKKSAEMKVAEYTKTVVKPAYDAFVDSKDDETTLAEHFAAIRKYYESAQQESNKQRQEDGNAGSSVNVVTTKFQHLSEWAYLNYDSHVIGFVFSLSKDKIGRDLQRIFFGSPQMEFLEKNMRSNIQQSLEDIRGELIVANTRLRTQALDPAPEPWLHKVNFHPKAANDRDRNRRVFPEILRHLTNYVIESNHDDAAVPPPRPLTAFPWSRWFSIAFRHHLTLVQWPAHLSPCPGQEKFDLHTISSSDISKMVRVWRNYKDNELSESDAEERVHIVGWSENEKAYELEHQKDIPLVVNSDREVLVTVQDVPEYLKLIGRHDKARALEQAHVRRKGKARHPSEAPVPQARPLPPRPAYREIDDYNAPMADPNKPRGGAVGPNGRLLDASEIDFTEENDDVVLPPASPHYRYRSPPSRHHYRSPSPHHQSPSLHRRHSPSPHHRSQSPQRHRSHSAHHQLTRTTNHKEYIPDDSKDERPTKRARYQGPTHGHAQYSPTKPGHKRTRNDEQDVQPPSEAEEFSSRKMKKLPPRAYKARPPTSTSSQVPRSRGKRRETYYDDHHNYSPRNQAGPSRQLYTINDEGFDAEY
ncbi:hypothetical protein EYR38_009922 [Pleurotus pulmonarius]|nr:hypothetical protein EYR38_009922 [Pleurotus pulmonarius]